MHPLWPFGERKNTQQYSPDEKACCGVQAVRTTFKKPAHRVTSLVETIGTFGQGNTRGYRVSGLLSMKFRAHIYDFVVIIIFVVIGRHAHRHGETIAGIASTTWPFLLGYIGAALTVSRARVNLISMIGGSIITVVTVVLGMILRLLSGQGTAPAFIVVAYFFLGFGFEIWRFAKSKMPLRK